MDTLYSALGQFYFATHYNTPPTFLQVVGWTKGAENSDAKRQYVYVRKVPLRIKQNVNGGQWEFDENVIKNYAVEIKTPIRKHSGIVAGNAIVIEGAHFIRYQGMTVPIQKFDYAPVSVCIPVKNVETELLDELLTVDEPVQYTRLRQ